MNNLNLQLVVECVLTLTCTVEIFFPVVCICSCKIIGYMYIITAHIPSAIKYMSDDQFTFLFN